MAVGVVACEAESHGLDGCTEADNPSGELLAEGAVCSGRWAMRFFSADSMSLEYRRMVTAVGSALNFLLRQLFCVGSAQSIVMRGQGPHAIST